MSLAILFSRANLGMYSPVVTVEVHLSNGLPHFAIVGLNEAAAKGSKDRTRSAIINSGFEFPGRRITINLAPADLPKDGAGFDLVIALGILIASQQFDTDAVEQYEFAAELALSGELRPIPGILPFALAAQKANKILVVAAENAEEASCVDDLQIIAAENLLQLVSHLCAQEKLSFFQKKNILISNDVHLDIADIRGQSHAKRALEIAASGQHSLLLYGPPGTGKTMLANRLPTLLPPLNLEQLLEVAVITSISGQKVKFEPQQLPPLRSPHHTISHAGLVGGGNPPRPGEITRAHHGVLFLDEFPEFQRRALEALREPLESKQITISRASRQLDFPANFLLVAAMNPCPCGHLGNPKQNCRCTPEQIKRYHARISGPLLERIDLQLEVPLIPHDVLIQTSITTNESSKEIQQRVIATRQIQLQRQQKMNNELTVKDLEQFCVLEQANQQFLELILQKLNLSIRSYHRILKIARTIADMAKMETIEKSHLLEAISLRRLGEILKGS